MPNPDRAEQCITANIRRRNPDGAKVGIRMPYVVNGQLVTNDRIRAEEVRIARHPQWQEIADKRDRDKRIRAEAEFSAIDVMLVEQVAARDPRPVDPALLEYQFRMQEALGTFRSACDVRQLRKWIEWNLRLQRTASEMSAGATKPTSAAIETFYQVHRENFYGCAAFEAAHIVKHVNEHQSEELARAGIEAALADLEAGMSFAQTADRQSDCRDKGGDLGRFLAGTMVKEFEDAIRHLEPGQRTGIFRTPFGFHIALLRSKTAAGPLDFEEVREDIQRVLTRIEEHQEYLRAVAALRAGAEIRWVPDVEKKNSEQRSEEPTSTRFDFATERSG